MIKYILPLILFSVTLLGRALPLIKIDTVFDGKGAQTEDISKLFKHEINELTKGEYEVVWLKSHYGDWNPKTIKELYQKALKNEKSDIVITMGLIGSSMITQEKMLSKPVIAPFTVNIDSKDPISNENQVKNLNFLTIQTDISSDFKILQKMIPFKKITLLVDEGYLKVMGDITQKITRFGQAGNFTFKIITATDDAQKTLQQLDSEDQIVYITPMPRFTQESFKDLIQNLNQRGIASFSRNHPEMIHYGVMAVMESDQYHVKIARRVALNIQSIMLGEKPEELSGVIESHDKLKLNMKTVRALGFSPGFEVLEEAELVNEEDHTIKKVWTFSQALEHGVKVNLDLMIKKHEESVQKESIRTAWTNYLPKVEASLTGLIIDDDRAAASFGQAPERQLFGTLSVTQLLYSNDALTNVEIQKDLVKEKTYLIEQTKQDIAEDIAIAYLNIMRAKTYERIIKSNIKLTRKHIELAKIRQRVGTAGPGEIYQWEAQLATNRKDSAKANSQRKMAQMMLNRLLNRPLEEPFLTREIDLKDPALITGYASIKQYIKNEKTFKLLRDFLVKDGLEGSYELKRINQGIAAQKKVRTMIKRRLWSPTVALKGEMSYKFYKGGEGIDGLSFDLPPELLAMLGAETAASLANAIPKSKNDFDWSIALNVSLPLFDRGDRFVKKDKNRKELAKLYLERQSLIQKFSQLIRSNSEQAAYTYSAIKFSVSAAQSAHKGYNLVKDAYQKGMTSMINLMDIQNRALSADLVAANASYDFLIDLIKLQRSIGKVHFGSKGIKQKEWLQKLKNSIEKR